MRGNDDLTALTHTVNGMLDRVEHAMTAQHQLLNDVGHELRTPLTIVRGYLEVMDPADADDVAASRDLVLDEVERMGDLADDLLLLATSDRPDFLTPRPTHLGELTDAVLDKARGLDRRPWQLDGLADATAVLDPERVTQAWLQLASNAVKYSPAGSPVVLGSAVRGGQAWLWVRDEGIGFPPDEREAVLQRFVRSRRPEARRPTSAGLGLAIVDNIARAHGGRVDIASELGRGSTVALVMPMDGPVKTEGSS